MLAWLLTGLVLAGAFSLAVVHQPLLTAFGVLRSGAPSTVAPTLFSPSPTPSPVVGTGGTGLADAADLPPMGVLPERATLDSRLSGLDRSRLAGVDGGAPQIAWQVVDVATGEVVGAAAETAPLIPASNTKTLTTVAVMNVFAGDERFATTVVQPAPGQIVLVGGGDPMLLSVPAAPGSYPQPPTTQQLAADTATALKAAGQTSVTLGFDDSLFVGSGWNDTWPVGYRDQVTPLSALWVDEGRTAGPRSRTPAVEAATVFAAQLAAAGVSVTGTPTQVAAAGTELARVESLPVHVLVETAMKQSNNSFTEVLGFQLALATGHPATFAGSVAAIEEQLTALGLWDAGSVLRDASGLSRSNQVTARMLAAALRVLSTDSRLSVILDGLPTAGVSGTLADRFTDEVSRPARGVARAKTGTLSFVSSLAGTTLTSDGRQVTFAFLINGPPDGWAARLWMDQATGVVAACGC